MREWRALPVLVLWAEGVFCASVVDHCQKDLIIGFEGKESVLQPIVHGTPKEITWKKEENIVHEWDGKDHSNGSLILRNISRSDAGIYTAEALVKEELQYTYYCLKVLDNLRPPDLNCFVHNDSIQVNCTAPPQITSQNLPVSYLWEDRGRSIHHEPYIQLQRNSFHPEEITCIVSIANVNASNSITLSGCIPEAQQAKPRTQTVLIALAVIVLIAGLAGIGILWKKGFIKKCQEDPGIAKDISLEQKQNRNESDRLLENSEEKGSESEARGMGDVSKNQEPSLKEEVLPSSVPTTDSDSAKNLEENEGVAVDISLEQKQNHNESDRLLENSEEKGSESKECGMGDVPENREQSLKEEGLSGPKPD